MKTTDILLDHIRQHPGCVSSDIYKAMAKIDDSKNISSMLSALTKRKLVTREEFFGKDNRKMFKYWIAGTEKIDLNKEVKAVITNEATKVLARQIDEKLLTVATVAKTMKHEKEKVKESTERYLVTVCAADYEHMEDEKPAMGINVFNTYNEAYAAAKIESEIHNYVSVLKIVKRFKRTVTIVEE